MFFVRLRRALPLLALIVLSAPVAAVTLLTEENPPFNFTEEGRLVGMSSEIVLEAARRANLPVKTEVLPWERAYLRAQAERDTCLFSTARLENRERLFVWVGPIATNLWALFGRADFSQTIRTLKDLQPYRIGAVTRDAKGEWLRENNVTGVRAVSGDDQNPRRLLLPRDDPDRIDLWITSLYAGREVARRAKVTDLKLVWIANEQPLYLACSPQVPAATTKALGEAIEALRADGTIGRITASYEKKFAR